MQMEKRMTFRLSIYLPLFETKQITQKCQGYQYSLTDWFTFYNSTVKMNWNVLQQINRVN